MTFSTLAEDVLFYTRLYRPEGDYLKTVEEDFHQIEPHLPQSVDSILDIGCGLAVIDVFLKRKYPKATLSLLDSDGTKASYGWSEDYRAYGSRDKTNSYLKENGITVDNWFPVGHSGLLKADLIISLLAWGFHFPLKTYNVEGLCVADLRLNKEPERGTVIARELKFNRCLFRLP